MGLGPGVPGWSRSPWPAEQGPISDLSAMGEMALELFLPKEEAKPAEMAKKLKDLQAGLEKLTAPGKGK